MKTAFLNLRHADDERHRIFTRGLQALGYTITKKPEGDLFVSWNLIHHAKELAKNFNDVVIVENASWGNTFAGNSWLHVVRNQHNIGGHGFAGSQRWDCIGVKLAPFREGGETVILAQRGIGQGGMPPNWPQNALKKYGGRIRVHPGKNEGIPLELDLKDCGRVITWGSGAAIKALMWGIPVISEMPNWIAEQNNTDAGRLAMFRRLAWAQWRMSEIESGEAFAFIIGI